LFPGKTVQIDTVCPDCGESIQLKVRDGVIEQFASAELIGHAAVPVARWLQDLPYA